VSRPELPPGLDDFGRQLREAAQRQAEADRSAHRSGARRWRPLIIAIAAAVLAAVAAAGAARIFDSEGPSLPKSPDSPRRLRPPADPGVVLSAAVADPGGGYPWTVRVFTNAAGEDCVAAGRLRAGKLGQVQNGLFRPLPAQTPGICGDLATVRVLPLVERRSTPAERTIVYGVSQSRHPISIRLGSRSRRVTPKALGAFITVFVGMRREPVVVRTIVDGRAFVRHLG
jgi:hypothetical protein